MRGEILEFDDAAGTGLISGDDGLRYRFERSALATPASVTRGLRVDFSPLGEDATQIMLLEAAPAPSPWAQTSVPGSAPYAAASGPAGTATSIDWANLFFSFNGRIRRTHYWIAWASLFVAGLVLGFVPFLGAFAPILLLWPNLAFAVKRLHDMGHTGWLIAIPYVVAIGAVAWMISAVGITTLEAMSDPGYADSMSPEQAMTLIGPMLGGFGLAALVSLGFWLWMGIAEGRPGTNKYGPDPKNPVDASTFS